MKKKRVIIIVLIVAILIIVGFLIGRFFFTKNKIDFGKMFYVGSFGVSGKMLAVPTEAIGEAVEQNYFKKVKLNPFEEES